MSSMTMSTKLPLALAFFLSASIFAAAAQSSDSSVLRAGVPYYMAPHPSVLGGGVAPARVGGEICPREVRLTPEGIPGVPITFWSPDGHVVINETTPVLISFNRSVPCGGKTWGNRFFVPMPSTVPILLLREAEVLIYESTRFRIKKDGIYHKFYYLKQGDEGVAEYNLDYKYDEENDFNRLVISKEKPGLRFYIHKAEDYDRMIKSVV